MCREMPLSPDSSVRAKVVVVEPTIGVGRSDGERRHNCRIHGRTDLMKGARQEWAFVLRRPSLPAAASVQS